MCELIEEYGEMKKAEGKAEGRAEGKAEIIAEAISQMLQSGYSHEDVARILKMPVDEVKERENLVVMNA